MADTAISGLGAIAHPLDMVAGDLLEVVDVSAGASGNKKMTLLELALTLQALLPANMVRIQPQGNGTTIAQFGTTLTAAGTATASNVANTSMYTHQRRVEYLVTTAAVSAVAGLRGPATLFLRGSADRRGGFFFKARFAQATGCTTSTRRCFCGLYGTAATPTDVNPSTLLNTIGVGYDAGDTNWQIMSNDGAGAATKIDTGIARPSVDRTDVVELTLYAAPNAGTVRYRFTNITTNTTVVGSLAMTDVPPTSAPLSYHMYASVGGTSSVVGFTLYELQIVDLTGT